MKPILRILSNATLAFTSISTVQATPPRLLPFQGRFTDASGTPVPDGAKVVQIKIHGSPTGGTALWPGKSRNSPSTAASSAPSSAAKPTSPCNLQRIQPHPTTPISEQVKP